MCTEVDWWCKSWCVTQEDLDILKMAYYLYNVGGRHGYTINQTTHYYLKFSIITGWLQTIVFENLKILSFCISVWNLLSFCVSFMMFIFHVTSCCIWFLKSITLLLYICLNKARVTNYVQVTLAKWHHTSWWRWCDGNNPRLLLTTLTKTCNKNWHF